MEPDEDDDTELDEGTIEMPLGYTPEEEDSIEMHVDARGQLVGRRIR